MQWNIQSHQVDEGEKLPAASVGLVCRHVQSFVVAEDGEVRQQDGDPENLRGDQRHDARCVCVHLPAFTSLHLLLPHCLTLLLPVLHLSAPLWLSSPLRPPFLTAASVLWWWWWWWWGRRKAEREGGRGGYCLQPVMHTYFMLLNQYKAALLNDSNKIYFMIFRHMFNVWFCLVKGCSSNYCH